MKNVFHMQVPEDDEYYDSDYYYYDDLVNNVEEDIFDNFEE